MKKKKTNIIKFISFLLLIFSFNLSVNAETTKIYYADDRGIRKQALTAPEGYPNNDGGTEVTLYSYRTITESYDPIKYYGCSADAESTVVKYQQMACGSEDSLDPTLTYEKENFYSCAKTPSDSVDGKKTEEGKKCNLYSAWSARSTEKPNGYDESKTDLYKSEKATMYFWYKEVANGTTISFENNEALYKAIKKKISTSDIEDAEINFLENPLRIVASDIIKVKKLSLNRCSIVSIDQLAYFTGLTDLGLSYNKIEKIDAIKNLVNLEHLGLENNAIISVEPIIGLKKLKDLDLSYNEITNLGLLKKIENYNSIVKNYYFNDFKKSGLIKNWSEFVDELLNFKSYYYGDYTIKNTNDSLIFYYNNSEIGKFELKNNILKFVSGKSEISLGMVYFLLAIGFSNSDFDKAANCADEDYKCLFSKFGDYLNFNITYNDNEDEIDKVDFSFDLNYFFGEATSNNPKTGVSNALVLLGITFMCSAIGFVVMYKHKTGIQL